MVGQGGVEVEWGGVGACMHVGVRACLLAFVCVRVWGDFGWGAGCCHRPALVRSRCSEGACNGTTQQHGTITTPRLRAGVLQCHRGHLGTSLNPKP